MADFLCDVCLADFLCDVRAQICFRPKYEYILDIFSIQDSWFLQFLPF